MLLVTEDKHTGLDRTGMVIILLNMYVINWRVEIFVIEKSIGEIAL